MGQPQRGGKFLDLSCTLVVVGCKVIFVSILSTISKQVKNSGKTYCSSTATDCLPPRMRAPFAPIFSDARFLLAGRRARRYQSNQTNLTFELLRGKLDVFTTAGTRTVQKWRHTARVVSSDIRCTKRDTANFSCEDRTRAKSRHTRGRGRGPIQLVVGMPLIFLWARQDCHARAKLSTARPALHTHAALLALSQKYIDQLHTNRRVCITFTVCDGIVL